MFQQAIVTILNLVTNAENAFLLCNFVTLNSSNVPTVWPTISITLEYLDDVVSVQGKIEAAVIEAVGLEGLLVTCLF